MGAGAWSGRNGDKMTSGQDDKRTKDEFGRYLLRELLWELDRFQMAYGRGDLNMLLGLFSPDARNNRGGLEAIAEDYRDFFGAGGLGDL